MPRTIQEFCAQFGREPPVHVRIGKRHFYDPHHLLADAQARHWDVFSVGRYLGETKQDFQPTSALIELIGAGSDRRVVVGDRAAWLFLCGRDILMEGVLDPGCFERGDAVFVCDERGDILGWGHIISRYDLKLRTKTFVKHRLDRGEYLRRER